MATEVPAANNSIAADWRPLPLLTGAGSASKQTGSWVVEHYLAAKARHHNPVVDNITLTQLQLRQPQCLSEQDLRAVHQAVATFASSSNPPLTYSQDWRGFCASRRQLLADGTWLMRVQSDLADSDSDYDPYDEADDLYAAVRMTSSESEVSDCDSTHDDSEDGDDSDAAIEYIDVPQALCPGVCSEHARDRHGCLAQWFVRCINEGRQQLGCSRDMHVIRRCHDSNSYGELGSEGQYPCWIQMRSSEAAEACEQSFVKCASTSYTAAHGASMSADELKAAIAAAEKEEVFCSLFSIRSKSCSGQTTLADKDGTLQPCGICFDTKRRHLRHQRS